MGTPVSRESNGRRKTLKPCPSTHQILPRGAPPGPSNRKRQAIAILTNQLDFSEVSLKAISFWSTTTKKGEEGGCLASFRVVARMNLSTYE